MGIVLALLALFLIMSLVLLSMTACWGLLCLGLALDIVLLQGLGMLLFLSSALIGCVTLNRSTKIRK